MGGATDNRSISIAIICRYHHFASNAAVSTYALEMSELVPSFLSTAWLDSHHNDSDDGNDSGGGGGGGGSCIWWEHTPIGDGCEIGVNVSITSQPDLPHADRVVSADGSGGSRPVRVSSRLLVEASPPDALPGYYCMHLISVSEASAPLVLEYAFRGLPTKAKQMLRIFDGDWFVNITDDSKAYLLRPIFPAVFIPHRRETGRPDPIQTLRLIHDCWPEQV